MRVDDQMLKCVGFVGEVAYTDSTGVYGDLVATGFFVSVPSEFGSFAYFVTAKHVPADLKGKGAYFLVNKEGGGTTLFSDIRGGWWTHPTDKTADVAVVQLGERRNAELVCISIEDFATGPMIRSRNIGIGDEVYTVGLFTPAPGVKRNMPIVRHGNVAMMPEEQIQTELGYADVYLVEARSIGGLSGSPVFVRPTNWIEMEKREDGDVRYLHGVDHWCTLLGLMHGHWDINRPELVEMRKRAEEDRKHRLEIESPVIPERELIEVRL